MVFRSSSSSDILLTFCVCLKKNCLSLVIFFFDMFNILGKISLFSKTLFIFLYIEKSTSCSYLEKIWGLWSYKLIILLDNEKSLYYIYMYLCNLLDLQKWHIVNMCYDETCLSVTHGNGKISRKRMVRGRHTRPAPRGV